jgi:hypothetical protein
VTPQSPAVQAIEVAGSALQDPLVVGRTVQLKAIARLLDGSERDVTSLASWSSRNPDVASVTPSGLVTARGRGAGRVSASYQNTTGETAFSVVDGAPPTSDPPGSTPGAPAGPGPTPGPTPTPGPGAPFPGTPATVKSLTITGDHTVPVGRSAQFRATAHMSDGSEKDVTTDADWRNNDSIVGAISQSGVLTGLTPGSNVVSADYGGASASRPVQVTPF